MSELSEAIKLLLDTLAPHCTPPVLHALQRDKFNPEHVDAPIAKPLHALRSLLGQTRYDAEIHACAVDARKRWESAQLRANAVAVATLRERLNADFLSTDFRFWTQSTGDLDPEAFDRERSQFVQDWAARTLPPGFTPDDEQSAAIASVHDHTLVTARAGSGKTRTLVSRAAFLIKHCRVAPTELLLLAFNRSAAKEIQDRLRRLGCVVPHVMTFHALAYAIVHPDERLLYDGPSESEQAQSQELQHVIDESLRSPATEAAVRRLLMNHFRADWEMLAQRGLTLSPEDGLAFRRNLQNETLRGEYVKSFGEKAIANFLFEHDISYQYERSHWWNGMNYRPDFTIPHGKTGVVIEYFGLLGNKEYGEQAEAKRQYWKRRHDWGFVEIGPADLGPDGASLHRILAPQLRHFGFRLNRLTDDEIWTRIRKRSITDFALLLGSFVGRCRRAGLSASDLPTRIRNHRALNDAEAQFLDIASELFARYIDRLKAAHAEDFGGLLERAAEAVAAGSTDFDRKSGRGDLSAIRFVMIDEYQDFSPLFMRLLNAIRRHNRGVQVLAVGDDWQAINGFAGSDLQYFHRFEAHMTSGGRRLIATNHRSHSRIVELGNAIMRNRGPQSRAASPQPGIVQLLDLAGFRPNAREQELYSGETFAPAIRRVLSKVLRESDSVGLLARQNRLSSVTGSGFADDLDTHLKRWLDGFWADKLERVQISTVHKFKGREVDTTVVLDAIERSFPLIHPHWVFTRVLGDSPQTILDEERRLFYVACTRAKRRLILITDSRRMSPFLRAVMPQCTQARWDDFPFVPEAVDRWIIEVRSQPGLGAGPTVAVKDLLKADGFRYKPQKESRKWERTDAIPNAGLSALVKSLQTQSWAVRGQGLQVHIREIEGKTLAVFDVDFGKWCPGL